MAKSTSAQAVVVANDQVAEKSLLDQIADQVHAGPEPGPNLSPAELEEAKAARGRIRRRGKDLIKEFIAQVLDGTMTIAKDAEMMINARIAQIDHLVSLQLNEIMHHPSLQKLEGTWRGLKYLMDQSETGAMLKIKILNCNKKELLKDLQRAPEFDQSALFKKVYEEEYGVFGGSPFGGPGGRLRIRQAPGRHRTAGAGLACGSGGPRSVHRGHRAGHVQPPDWSTLDAPRDLAKIFDTTEYAKWKSFRQSEDSRYVALCLPRVLGRLPYGKDTKPIEDFNYEEHVDGSDHSKYLWMNAAYTLAARMTNSFS